MSIHLARDQRRGGRGTVEARQRRRMRPTLMALEDRRLLSTFTVNSTLDNGSAGTLRWAVGQANLAGTDHHRRGEREGRRRIELCRHGHAD